MNTRRAPWRGLHVLLMVALAGCAHHSPSSPASSSARDTHAAHVTKTADAGPGPDLSQVKNPHLLPAAIHESAPNSSDSELLQAAHDTWRQRDAQSAVVKTLGLLEELSLRRPNDANIATWLSRAEFVLASQHRLAHTDNESMLKALQRGMLMGEHALLASNPNYADRIRKGDSIEEAVDSLEANDVEALCWYVSNLGLFVATHGKTAQLFYHNRIEALLLRLVALNETLFFAAPRRYLGVYYAKVPRFIGGDKDASRKHFERALALAPNGVANYVLFAEALTWPAKQKEETLSLLTRALHVDANQIPEWAPEIRLDQQRARNLLERVQATP